MGDDFAFLLPISMALFGGTFLYVWRAGAAPALYWALGYLLAAVAFCIPVIALLMPGRAWAIVADTLFALAYLCYGQAILARVGRPSLLAIRLPILFVSLAFCIGARIAGSLRGELIASDIGCLALILVALGGMVGRMRRPAERALFAAVCLVALDSILRISTVFITTPSGPVTSFLSTQYAFLMQTLASVLGTLMALVALTVEVMTMIAGYRRDAFTDPLTGLHNRRGFDNALEQRTAGARSGAVLMCDIDHFKRINDSFGHAAGDRVIAALAGIIRNRMPRNAIAARCGGEEFVVYLPGADTLEASRFATSVRSAFAAHDWMADGIEGALSASFGLSLLHAQDEALADAVARADAALYEAKAAGRDRVAVKRDGEPAYTPAFLIDAPLIDPVQADSTRPDPAQPNPSLRMTG
jgi:diguanylate cyclase (GGDEF)-like protein